MRFFGDFNFGNITLIDVFGTESGEAGTKIRNEASDVFCQIGYKVCGATDLWYDGENFDYSGGSILYLPQADRKGIDYHKTITEKGRSICIFFRADGGFPTYARLFRADKAEADKRFLRLLSAFSEERAVCGSAEKHFECMSAFYSVLSLIASCKNEKDDQKRRADCDAAISYMKEHLCDAYLDMTALASLSGVSRDRFRHKFRERYGVSPLAFYADMKTERIKEFLRAGFSVSEAAELTGFSDPNYFSRFFKKHTGMSCTEYIKIIR